MIREEKGKPGENLRKLDLAFSLMLEVLKSLDLSERVCTGCLHGAHTIKNNFDDYRVGRELSPAITRIEKAMNELRAPRNEPIESFRNE